MEEERVDGQVRLGHHTPEPSFESQRHAGDTSRERTTSSPSLNPLPLISSNTRETGPGVKKGERTDESVDGAKDLGELSRPHETEGKFQKQTLSSLGKVERRGRGGAGPCLRS